MKNGKRTLAIALTTIMLCALLSACGETVSPDGSKYGDGELYEIKWYVVGPGPQADQQMVLDAFNERVRKTLPIKLNLVMVDYGSYDQKMQMVISSQEKFDLCFTANWANNFISNTMKNAYMPLDELLQYAPDVMKNVPDYGWKGTTINGKIYGVPNYQCWPITSGFTIRDDILEKYGININTIATLEDIGPKYAQIILENEPDMYALDSSKGWKTLDFMTYYLGYDELAGRHIPGVVMLDDTGLKAISQFELPYYRKMLDIFRDWYLKGYVRKDAATLGDCRADQKAGILPFFWEGTLKPGGNVETGNNVFGGRTATSKALAVPYLTTSAVESTITAISATCEDPVLTMKFYNLLYTDKELYNMLCYGLEGTHFVKTGENTIRLTEAAANYQPNTDWLFGSQFNAYILEGKAPDIWEQTQKWNESATKSAAYGFVFNPQSVMTEIANVSAVNDQYLPLLSTGSVDVDKTYPEFLEKLKAAGSERIIAEVQKQLDDWKAAR